MRYFTAGLALLLIFTVSCSSNSSSEETSEPANNTIKLFAQDRPGGEHFNFDMPVLKGLDHLEIESASFTSVDSNELVLGLNVNEQSLALPIRFLSGFEVANLKLEEANYLVTWCPLVGSARIYEGKLADDDSGFDFGRGLKDNNLLIVDRKTNSVWNQLSCKSIKGELEGERLRPLAGTQTTWTNWKDKHPDTKLIVNKDTSEAVFPSEVLVKQYYNTWVPGERYPAPDGNHYTDNLGLGIEIGDSSVYYHLSELFKLDAPLSTQINGEAVEIHFDEAGLTAWVTDKNGTPLPSVLVYDWAWKNFFPNARGF